MKSIHDIFLIILLIYLSNSWCNSCEIKAKAPCIFPFIFKDKTYNSCTKVESKSNEFWCATYVNDTSHVQDNYYRAKCEDFCASENADNEISFNCGFDSIVIFSK